MGVLESLSELVLNVKKEKIDKAIKDSKKTKNWREVEALPSYQKLDANEINLFAINYKKNIIDKSKKFKKLPEEKQQEILQQWQDRTTSQMFEAAKKKPVANIPLVNAMNLGGIPVEKAAQLIEPDLSKMTADTSGLGIAALATRQGVAEYLRFNKPWNLLAASAVGKTLQKVVPPVAKGITKIIPSKIKDPIARFFTTDKGQPIAYQALRERNILGKAEGGREAEAVAKTLSTSIGGKPLTRQEQRIVGRIFRGKAETIKGYPKYKPYADIAKEGRGVMDKWSKELVKSGIPSKEAQEIIEDNVGNYMGRFYNKHINNPKGNFFSKKNLRLRLNGLKHKKDLTSQVRRTMGEIKEPALPTAIRVKEISETVENAKLFSTVANNPEWVADTNLTGKMIKLPKNPTLGALKGKWVVPSIGDDINGILKAKDTSQSFMGVMGNLYTKGYSKWKYGKVVLNPATHVRNMVSNSMLLDLSGVNHLRQLQLMPKVLKDYLGKGKMYQMALKEGAIGGEFVGTEVAAISKQYATGTGGNMSRWMNVLKAKGFSPAKFYQGEEQIAKMVKFTDMISKGANPQLAAKEAQKWLFNYSKIPGVIEFAKQLSPFITFTYKALPRIGEAMAKNPLKVYKYYAFFKSWNETTKKLHGLTPEEFAREQNALPPWLMKSLGGVPMTLMMPWRDKHNRSQWLNLEYMLPIGMAPEVIRQGAAGLITNPLYSLVSDLSKNKDFKDQDIIPEGTPKGEAFKIATNYIYKQLAPSLAPGIKGHKGWEGGYSWSKILNSMEKIPDYADRIRSVPSALLDSLVGFKLTPVDINESEYFSTKDKNSKTRDIQNQIRRLNHPAISEEYREKRAEELFKRIQKIWGD